MVHSNYNNTINEDIKPVLESIFTEANAELNQAPDTLYHYTDAKGLLGILESGKFHATHYRYLNDPSEITYSVPIILEELVKIRDTKTNTTLQNALHDVETTQKFLDEIDDNIPIDIFIASFSNEIANGTQWEMYANKGKGFAIGINPKATHYYDDFLIDLRPFKSPKYFLVKVVYDEEIQRHIITTSLSKLIHFIEKHNDSALSVNVIKEKILTLCILLAVLCKNKSFEYENEWRFIHCRYSFPFFELNLKDQDQKRNYLSFRNRNETIIPYAKLDFSKEAAVAQAFDYDPNLKLMPLKNIIIGPRRHDYKNVKNAIRNLLTSQGYDVSPDLIEKSTIPK